MPLGMILSDHQNCYWTDIVIFSVH